MVSNRVKEETFSLPLENGRADATGATLMVRNAILLTLDALGAGHVGHLGYERDTTPRLDALARKSRAFRTCLAQSSHTRESMPSLFSSAYPSQLGGVGSVPAGRTTLPEVLSSAGLATAGFHSNPYLSRAYTFDRGFDHFDDALSLASNRLVTLAHRVVNHFRNQPYLRAEALNEKGLEWLKDANTDRCFLWLHYMDPHGPYQPPEEYQRLFREEIIGQKRAKSLWRRTVDEPETITPADRDVLIDLYDAEIRYADAMLGKFLDTLDEHNLLSESIVVIGADHGDAFGEHGHYGHPRRVYEELVHVPLIVKMPDKRSATVDRPVENLSIAPTILDAFDIAVPDEFEGSSLLSREFGTNDGKGATNRANSIEQVAVSEATGESDDEGRRWTGIRSQTAKLHVVTDLASDEILETSAYDLATDPTESTPSKDDAVCEQLLGAYHDHRNRVGEQSAETEQPDDNIDPVVADRLEDLGYQ